MALTKVGTHWQYSQPLGPSAKVKACEDCVKLFARRGLITDCRLTGSENDARASYHIFSYLSESWPIKRILQRTWQDVIIITHVWSSFGNTFRSLMKEGGFTITVATKKSIILRVVLWSWSAQLPSDKKINFCEKRRFSSNISYW